MNDSRIAQRAETRLLGLSDVDLESCLGVADQHAVFGHTEVLTYYGTSTSSTAVSFAPVLGGMGLTYGAYCHATFRLDDGRVTRVLYSGEKNATGAPDAYCAPIVRTCLAYLDQHPAAGPPRPAPAAPPAMLPAPFKQVPSSLN
ncbi:MAG: hypothetical protein J0I21_19165 [Alphaproteobacteria bacterium]|nr:hypothetical protein [Alphaproteobacteria bacterium]